MVREYKIIRLYNGKVTLLSGDFDEASGEVTFATDQFLTYAIVYSDTLRNGSGDSGNSGK